jgi:RNA polymerase I-associated factor PAF67
MRLAPNLFIQVSRVKGCAVPCLCFYRSLRVMTMLWDLPHVERHIFDSLVNSILCIHAVLIICCALLRWLCDSAVPDYSSGSNSNLDAYSQQVSIFMTEVSQNVSVLKLRSYLRLYAAIDTAKLARFTDSSEAEFVNKLISFKHKATQSQSSSASLPGTTNKFTSDVVYSIRDGNVVIDAASSQFDKGKSAEKDFIAGVRKHAEIISDLQRAFDASGI